MYAASCLSITYIFDQKIVLTVYCQEGAVELCPFAKAVIVITVIFKSYRMAKKLHRRKFLKKAGIVCGVIFTAHHTFARKEVTSVFLKKGFLDFLPKQTHSLQTLNDSSLLNSYKTALSHWQQSGYKAHGSNYYICQYREVALFPLLLEHDSVGLLDQAILCFEKSEAGEWIRLRSLAGFELEALSVAASNLLFDRPASALADYLLPVVSSIRTESFSFITSKGSVSIKTFLSDTNSRTEISVKETNETLFQQTITSTHQLVQ